MIETIKEVGNLKTINYSYERMLSRSQQRENCWILTIICNKTENLVNTIFQARNAAGWSDFSHEFLFYTRGEGKLLKCNEFFVSISWAEPTTTTTNLFISFLNL